MPRPSRLVTMEAIGQVELHPLFIGPMEMALIVLILLVIVFGSRAPDMAAKAGESFGKVDQSKAKVQAEIDDIKGTPDRVKEDLGVDEDLKEIQEGVESVETTMDPEAEVAEEEKPDSATNQST